MRWCSSGHRPAGRRLDRHQPVGRAAADRRDARRRDAPAASSPCSATAASATPRPTTTTAGWPRRASTSRRTRRRWSTSTTPASWVEPTSAGPDPRDRRAFVTRRRPLDLRASDTPAPATADPRGRHARPDTARARQRRGPGRADTRRSALDAADLVARVERATGRRARRRRPAAVAVDALRAALPRVRRASTTAGSGSPSCSPSAASSRRSRGPRSATLTAGRGRRVAAAGPGDLPDQLFALIASFDGPSLARLLHREATAEQFREVLVHRSIYQLKEADPHTWAIPRLPDGRQGRAGGAAVRRVRRRPARPAARHPVRRGRWPPAASTGRYGAYVDAVPGLTLALNNAMSLFGLHRRLRGASMATSRRSRSTSSLPCRKYVRGLRRLDLPEEIAEYFDEHVEADAVHEQVAVRDICGALVEQQPELAEEVCFGAAASPAHRLPARRARAHELAARPRVLAAQPRQTEAVAWCDRRTIAVGEGELTPESDGRGGHDAVSRTGRCWCGARTPYATRTARCTHRPGRWSRSAPARSRSGCPGATAPTRWSPPPPADDESTRTHGKTSSSRRERRKVRSSRRERTERPVESARTS